MPNNTPIYYDPLLHGNVMLEQEKGELHGFRWLGTAFTDPGPSAAENTLRREHGRLAMLHLIVQITGDPDLPWRIKAHAQ